MATLSELTILSMTHAAVDKGLAECWTPNLVLFLWNKRTRMEKLSKLPILSKNASNKPCLEFNFLQKSQGAPMSITFSSGGRRVRRLPCLKYCNMPKWERRSTSGLNGGKITDYIKKCFKLKLFKIKFLTKVSLRILCLFHPGVELRDSKDGHFWNILMRWNGKMRSL